MPADPLDALRLPIVPMEPRPEFAEALLRRMQSVEQTERRTTPTIRYFVKDMDTAVEFYRQHLGFEEELRPSPVFAMLYRDDLRLLLSVPGHPSRRTRAARRHAAHTRRMESHPDPGRRPRRDGRVLAPRGCPLPRRPALRSCRQTGPARRPVRQSDRVVRTRGRVPRATPLKSRLSSARRRHQMTQDTDTVNVRYMVDDVAAAVDFYTTASRVRPSDQSGASVRRRETRQSAAAAQRPRQLGWTTHARRQAAWPGRVESHSPACRRHRCRSRPAARGGRELPKRRCHRSRWEADPARRPVRQPDRAVSAGRT